MKQFFKAVFTHLFALCLFFGGILMLGMLLLVGIAATGEQKVTIEKGSVLQFDLGMNISDAPPGFDPNHIFAELQGANLPTQMSLRAVVRAIDAAAKDERISGIHLSGNLFSMNYGSGFATLREVRQALQRFRESGKKVTAYFVFADNKDYYLASVADEIVLHPSGGLGVMGLAAEQVFLKGMFDKYGIGVNVVRAGKYKSAGESFSRENFSPEEREQLTQLLDGIWSEMVGAIAEARSLSREKVQELVDSGDLMSATSAVEGGLATRLAKEDEVLGDLAEMAGRERDDADFPTVDLATYAQEARKGASKNSGSDGEIAVVYAEGVIVDGEGEIGEVGADKFVPMLREISEDKDVKAVVLRVNSPGGSAIASERIVDELRRFGEKGIPVVVSMGTVAASGGYYIAMASDRIYVQPNTITGSIGVIGLLPNFAGLASTHGVTRDGVKTGAFADLGSVLREPSRAELDLIQRSVDEFYETFLEVVSEGRKLSRDEAHAVAQGRVWTGPAAIENRLADEIGGLQDAIRHAAKLADLGDAYRVRDYPRARSFEDFLEEAFKTSRPAVRWALGTRRQDPVEQTIARIRSEISSLSALNDPKGVYFRMSYDLALD